MPKIPLGTWVTDVVDFLTEHGKPVFNAISDVVGGLVHGLSDVLAAPPSPALAAVVAILCWWLRGLLAGVLTMVGLILIDALGQWNAAMQTLSLVLVASLAALIIGIPLGILSARVQAVSVIVRPVLDFMQTMPAFVYLIPALSFFGLGEVPGVIATMIFAIPPGVRLTELGIKQVDRETVEAAEAFGTSPSRVLTRVQLPLALPTIMTGVNQVIMLSLSMVVISGMVGAEGLGANVFGAITQFNLSDGVESGLSVVLLAIILDRMTGALGRRLAPAARRDVGAAVHGGLFTVLRYRPQPAMALSGVTAFALLATMLGIVGSGGKGGKPITIGYIPWDEDIAITHLWKSRLEAKGYKVNLRQVDAGPLFAGLGRGDIDLFFDGWLPATHADYYAKYKDKLEDIGIWYDRASLQLAVPKDDPANSIADLKGQADRYKGRVVGIEPGAGEMKIAKDKVLPAYGLNGDYKLVASSTLAMLSELNRSVQSKEPIVVTLWKPHWAYSKFPIKPLADPQNAFGSAEKIHTLGRAGFAKDFPEVNRWLKGFTMTDQQLFPLEDLVMNKFKGRESQGVDEWVKQNPDVVEKLTK